MTDLLRCQNEEEAWTEPLPHLLAPTSMFNPCTTSMLTVENSITRNSSADEIANVNFLYDDIVHVLQNAIDSCIPPQIDAAVMCGTHVFQIQ